MNESWWDAIDAFVREKAEGFKQAQVGKAVAAAAARKPLSFPAGLAAGGAAGEVSFNDFYTLGTYAGASVAVQRYILGPARLFTNVPAYVRGPARFLFGPVALAVTSAGTLYRKYIDPADADESTLKVVGFGLITGGLENQPLFPDLPELLRGTFFDFYGPRRDPFGRNHDLQDSWRGLIQLIPVWESDP